MPESDIKQTFIQLKNKLRNLLKRYDKKYTENFNKIET